MNFMSECCLLERDQKEQEVLESLEVDFHEGKADFAFGLMPQQPLNPIYIDGWMTALRQGVIDVDGVPVYPEATYRAKVTSDRNAAIFTNIDFAEF